MKYALAAVFCLVIAGCSSSSKAPIVERLPDKKASTRPVQTGDWRPNTYTVKKGDTLYSIALDHGLGYRELAESNGIENPNKIRVGHVLKLPKSDVVAVVTPSRSDAVAVVTPLKPASAPVEKSDGNPPLFSEPKSLKQVYSTTTQPETSRPATKVEQAGKIEPVADKEPVKQASVPSSQPVDDEDMDFSWPVVGKLLAGFSEGANKGLDIAGKPSQPVYAAASGKVVYSGSGLRGYGKLIIIKHNKTYLSAYAHNNQILVKEGQVIAKGQKIAEMGSTDTDQVKLHFEIRRFGKPVDPAKYLPAEKA